MHRHARLPERAAGRTTQARWQGAEHETAHEAVLSLQRSAGNRAVQRLVDQAKAQERVTDSEYKDLKARLDASAGTGMANLHTGQFIRLASLFRKNRDSLNMLKSDPLEHLATSPYESQDNFVDAKLHEEVETFSVPNQNKLVDNPVSTGDLLDSVGSLSEQSKKHIAVPKHAWPRVVASPDTFQPSDESADARLHDPSWEQVAAVMGAVVASGRQTLYRSTFQRILDVGGEQVAVTFAVIGEKPRVSDAWVVTR